MRSVQEYRVQPCLYLVRGDHLRKLGLRFYPGIAHEDNLFTFELMLATASGTKTKSELHGYGQNEFVPWPLGAVM